MKKTIVLFIIIFNFSTLFSQTKSDLEKLVETEQSFAQAAAEKGIKPAFLEFLADDGILFRPNAVNGKESWLARPASPALLSWYPTFVDVSSNGVLGYTTGPGEYRPNGKADTTVYYSEYATLWRRQPDGNFKAVVDIGISHDKPPTADTSWTSPKVTEKITDGNKTLAANAMNLFFDTATTKGLDKAYKLFAAEDVRFLRDEKFPILGKNNALAEVKNKPKISFGKNVTIQSAGDLAYLNTTYQLKKGDKIIEQGNIMQIWKLRGGKWQIVLDIFAPIPSK